MNNVPKIKKIEQKTLLELRKEAGMSREKLATAVGMSVGEIRRIEIGERAMTSASAERFAKVLNIDPALIKRYKSAHKKENLESGKALHALRDEYGISSRELAERIGVPFPTLCCYESGLALPSQDTIAKIANIYGLSVDDMLARGVRMQNPVQKDNPIFKARTDAGLSVTRLAECLGASRRIVQIWECSQCKPQPHTIKKIAAICNVDPDKLSADILESYFKAHPEKNPNKVCKNDK